MSAAAIHHPDPIEVRRHVEIIHAAASSALHGASNPGVLQLSVLHPGGSTMQSTRFPIGAVDAMADAAIQAAEDGLNVYVEARTVEARARGRGDAGATRGVFGFVDDADHDKGKGGKLLLRPSIDVETSPGNRQAWLFLKRALTASEADPIGRAMRAAVGSDSATAKLTQPYRIAGTINFPDARKLARGRVVCPTRILSFGGPVYSVAELLTAFPPISEAARREAPSGRSGQSSATVEEIVAAAGADRSGRFFRAIVRAIEAGMLPGDVEDAMRRHPDGCGGKYLEGYDRLAEEIARAWPKAEERLKRPAVDPTWPDRGVHVAEARQAVRQAISDHLAAKSGYRAIKVATGVGKTRIAAEMIAADVRRRRLLDDKRAFLYSVPRHKLGDEVAALFEAEGVSARVFRGRNADDPHAADLGLKMCLDLPVVELALKLGAPVSTSCCRGKHPITATEVTCQFFDACAYQAQLHDKPAVWLVPHQLLFQAQAALGEVAGVLIDESFWQAGLVHASKGGLTLDEVGAGPKLAAGFLDDVAADLAEYRGKLARALRRQESLGGVEQQHLTAENIDADLCTRAISAEYKLKAKADIWPGMGQQARRAAAQAAERFSRTGAFLALWNAARDLAAQKSGTAVSGRLILAEVDTEDGFGKARVARTRGLRPIAKSWAEVPTLAMDATLPDLSILREFYPEMEIVADIEAKTPHARVRQVLGAPVSVNKLMRSEAERNLHSVRRALLHRFLEVGRASTLVITQQKVAEWLKASSLPAGIEVAHFNAVSGLDKFKGVRLLIVIGRTLPNIIEVEAMAGAISGVEVVKTAEPLKGPRWYDRTVLGLRLKDGTGHPVDGDRHPDPTAEAVRWQVCEGEMMQAIGRARAVNRSAANPVNIEIWNDLVLPLTIDAVMSWENLPAGYEVEMIADGVVLGSPSDMADCWPEIWETAQAARHWQRRTSVQNPIEEYLNRVLNACGPGTGRPAGFRYRRTGERQKWRRGWYIPAVVPDPRAWLEGHLRTVLAQFEFVSAVDDDAADEPVAGEDPAPHEHSEAA